MHPWLGTGNNDKMVDEGASIPDSFWNSLLSSNPQICPSLADNERLTEPSCTSALLDMNLPISTADQVPETLALAPLAEKPDDSLMPRKNQDIDPELMVPIEKVKTKVCNYDEGAQDTDSSKLLDKALRSMSAEFGTQPPPEALEGLAFFIAQAMPSFSAEIDWIDTLFYTSKMIKAQRDSRHVAFSLESSPSVPDQAPIGGRSNSNKRRTADAGQPNTKDSPPAIPKKLHFRRRSPLSLPKASKRAYNGAHRFSRSRIMDSDEGDDSDIEVISCAKKPAFRSLSHSPPALAPHPATGSSSQHSKASSSSSSRPSGSRRISASNARGPSPSSNSCLASTSRDLSTSNPNVPPAATPINSLPSNPRGFPASERRAILFAASKGASSSALRGLGSLLNKRSMIKRTTIGTPKEHESKKRN